MISKREKDIFEIRIHGRAGQGVKTLAQFIVEGAMREGKFIQAFPTYGAEREGAPMEAYVRISSKPILLHCAVLDPDCMIIIDPTILNLEEIRAGLDRRDIFLANTKLAAKDLQNQIKISARTFTLDASHISRQILGKNFPNIVLLGAFSKIVDFVKLENLEEIIFKKFQRKLGEEMARKNIEAMKAGYQAIKI